MADGTGPFLIGPRLARLTGAYPSPPHVLEAAAEGPREKAILARLWISKGIPFAFKQCPGLYEELRQSLAERLGLDAKQISIAGSGRLGQPPATSHLRRAGSRPLPITILLEHRCGDR